MFDASSVLEAHDAGRAIEHLFEDAGLSVTGMMIDPSGKWRVDDKWP
jgi:hypothetical protein